LAIYLDIIWLLNLCFDSLLLLLTATILKRRVNIWRILIGAFIGSTLVLLMFTPLSHYASHPIIKLFFSFFIVLVTFGFKRFRYFFENLLTFYFSTFVIGGGLIAIHYLLRDTTSINFRVIATYTTGLGDPVSWFFVLVGFPLLWFFSKNRIEGFTEKRIRYDCIVDVSITFEETNITLRGLIDSGNHLYDPLTKQPVMIVEMNAVKDILPPALSEINAQFSNLDFISDEHLGKWYSRLRIIPYRVVGKEQQFLLALKPDKILIYYENQWIEVTKGLVGLSNTRLSADEDYQCIVHPKMVQSAKVSTAS